MAQHHLRRLAVADVPMILSWRNHEDVRRFMFTQHEISAEEHAALRRAAQAAGQAMYDIEVRDTAGGAAVASGYAHVLVAKGAP